MTGPLRVLLVDDHAMVRSGFAMVLSVEDDIEVVGEAADGVDAVALAASTDADVILMDVRMPGMGGIETARRLAADHPDTLVVLVSGYDLDDAETLAAATGAITFERKEQLRPGRLKELWAKGGKPDRTVAKPS